MAFQTAGKVSLAVGSASVLVVAVAVIGVVSASRLVASAKLVAHTQEVRAEMHALSQELDAADAEARGFALTGDSAFIKSCCTNLDRAEAAFGRLVQMTADNPAQQTRLASARTLLTQYEAVIKRTLAFRGEPDAGHFRLAQTLSRGTDLNARIDSLMNAAEGEERALLAASAGREVRNEWGVWFASAALVVLTAGLVLALMRSIQRDLTGRARAEAGLRASEAKFAGILGIAADAIITIDENRSIVHFNRGAQQVFGYDEADVIGKPLEFLLPDRHSHAHAEHVASFAAGADSSRRMGERIQVSGRRESGEEFPAEVSISKLQTPDGLIFTAVLRDVTQQKRIEDEEHALVTASGLLAESVEYDRALATVARLPVPAVGAWAVLDVIQESETGERTLRRITSGHPDPVVDAALRESEQEPLDWDSPSAVIDVLRNRKPQRLDAVSDDWLEGHTANAREIERARRIGLHSVCIVPLVAHDHVLGAWTIGSSAEHVLDDHDIALATKLAERAALAIEAARLLARSQRAIAARDQVLGIVSHDLRNPLSAVSMLARRLVDDPPDDAARRTIGDHILTSVGWMHRLMQDLLDVSSIDAGRLSVEMEPQAFHDIARSAMNMFADRAAANEVTLRSEVSASLPLVSADGSRIVQVLGNLVSNAMNFTPRGGTITVGARPMGEEVLVWVRDSGAGIPAGNLAHVFDRFWHAKRKDGSRGTGLGLAIAQGIVQCHGGRIWAESEVGVGSTFSFTLPLHRQSHSGALPTASATRVAAG